MQSSNTNTNPLIPLKDEISLEDTATVREAVNLGSVA